MWMSDSFNAPSGFGQQTYQIVSRLTDPEGAHPIHIDNVAWQWTGNPALFNDNWRVLPSGGRFASAILPHHIRIYKPDLIITLADLWNVGYLMSLRREHKFKWMEWLPIDGKPINNKMKWTSQYNEIDVIVAMSDFGEQELLNGRKKWVEKLDRPDPETEIEKIYHGIDTGIFRPFDEESRLGLRRSYDWQPDFPFDTELRQKFVKGEEKLEDYFIFGIVARNQPRKNYPTLLQAWAEFAEDNPGVLLWIHACPNDPAGQNLYFIVDQLKCADSVIFSDSVSQWYGKNSHEMADIFNLFDCHFLPTSGEGFGIPTVEAMACGNLIAVTDFTTGTELTDGGKAGYLMHNDKTYIDPGHVMRVKFTVPEIVSHLENILVMSEHRAHRLRKQARLRAVNTYDIFGIVAQWYKLIEKHMDDIPTKRVLTHDLEAALQRHYDRGYMATREFDAQQSYARNEYRFIGSQLEEDDHVLEIGCGSGEGMIFITRYYNVRVLGCDVSEESIKMCRKKGLNVYKYDFNEYYLDYPQSHFDVVFSQHVIEHMEDDERALLETIRVAKRAAIHAIPHDNMRDSEHKRPYKEEDVMALMSRVVNAWNTTMDGELKTTLHKNYVLDENSKDTLVSFIMVFKKEVN